MLRGSSNLYIRVISPARKSISDIMSSSIWTLNLRAEELQIMLLPAECEYSLPFSGIDSPSP